MDYLTEIDEKHISNSSPYQSIGVNFSSLGIW
ncbi:MAG: hypothetical protein PWQ51_2474 [Methanolobus sp.]|jgi:hypothetical protein|nr:hypothetical protein [Methanolobus sp.]